jgi:hypothetical protein
VRARSPKLAAYERQARPARARVIDSARGRCLIYDEVMAFDLRWSGLPLPREYDDALVKAMRGCRRLASGCHERRKRSAQGSLDDPANLVPACWPCNQWVENWPELAHRMGLVVRAGDRLYASLGRSAEAGDTDG